MNKQIKNFQRKPQKNFLFAFFLFCFLVCVCGGGGVGITNICWHHLDIYFPHQQNDVVHMYQENIHIQIQKLGLRIGPYMTFPSFPFFFFFLEWGGGGGGLQFFKKLNRKKNYWQLETVDLVLKLEKVLGGPEALAAMPLGSLWTHNEKKNHKWVGMREWKVVVFLTLPLI